MYVLDRLWRGEITPAERSVRQGSQYQRTVREFCAGMDELLRLLSPEAKEQLNAVSELKTDISMMENEDSFICGFRLGMGILLDVVFACEGQFTEPNTAG